MFSTKSEKDSVCETVETIFLPLADHLNSCEAGHVKLALHILRNTPIATRESQPVGCPFVNEHLREVDDMSTRLRNCLLRANINTTKDLIYIPLDRLQKIRNFGATSLNELHDFCARRDIVIGSAFTEEPEYKPGDQVITVVNTNYRYNHPKGTVMTVRSVDKALYPSFSSYICVPDIAFDEHDIVLCTPGMIERY